MWAVRSGDSEWTRNEAAPLSRDGQARHPVRGERLLGNPQEPGGLHIGFNVASGMINLDIERACRRLDLRTLKIEVPLRLGRGRLIHGA